MPTGIPLPKETINYIHREAIKPANIKRKEEDLAQDIEKRTRVARLGNPARSTIIKEISTARADLRRKGYSIQDKPWELGHYSGLTEIRSIDLPHNNLSSIMNIWKYHQNNGIGDLFSIRQAKWVSILSNNIYSIKHLAKCSSLYAEREFACEVLEKALYTDDLDTVWSSNPWELITLYLTGKARIPDFWQFCSVEHVDNKLQKTFIDESESLEYLIGCGRTEPDEESINADIYLAEQIFLGTSFQKGVYHYRRDEDLPPANEWQVSIEAKIVYLLWLDYMKDGCNYSSLTHEDLRDILKQLRAWINRYHDQKQEDLIGIVLNAIGTAGLFIKHSHKLNVNSGQSPHSLLGLVGL